MKIKINGNEYGLAWGMPCLADVCERLDFPIEKVIDLICGFGEYSAIERSKATAYCVLCAIDHYAKLKREEKPDITIEEVWQYVDETPQDKFQLVKNDFTDSMINGRKVWEILNMSNPFPAPEQKKSPKASTKKS
jgi:hypothetical protein